MESVEVEIDLDDLAMVSNEELVATICQCHCQSCGIILNLENSYNGIECFMCAIPKSKEKQKMDNLMWEDSKRCIKIAWEKEEKAAKDAVIDEVLTQKAKGNLQISITKYQSGDYYSYVAYIEYPGHDRETKKLHEDINKCDKEISKLQDKILNAEHVIKYQDDKIKMWKNDSHHKDAVIELKNEALNNLKSEIEKLKKTISDVQDNLHEAYRELKRERECNDFYGNKDNWTTMESDYGRWSKLNNDDIDKDFNGQFTRHIGGKRAREIIKARKVKL